MLKGPAALVAAVAVRRVLHVGWKLVTGTEPPAAPGDRQVPLGQAVAWAALFGGAITTARMLASRQVSSLWQPRARRQGVPEPGQADSTGQPLPPPEAPGLPSLMAVAVLAWRRRR